MPLWYNETIGEYLKFAEANQNDVVKTICISETGKRIEEILKTASIGDESLVSEAEKYLERFNTYRFESQGYRWTAAPNGGFASVPDYLSGSPTPMRQRRKVIADTSPLRVFVGATLNSGCTVSQFRERGIIITSLVMFLQRIRPVALYLWEDSRGHRPAQVTDRPTDSDGSFITVVNIGTAPVNLGQIGYLMSSADFSRGVMYGMVGRKDPMSYGYSYPAHYLHMNTYDPTKIGPDDFSYIKWLRGYLGASDSDVFIPSAHTSQMLDNPLDWLDRMLKKVTPEWRD